jgi:uncharacterized protein YkwD
VNTVLKIFLLIGIALLLVCYFSSANDFDTAKDFNPTNKVMQTTLAPTTAETNVEWLNAATQSTDETVDKPADSQLVELLTLHNSARTKPSQFKSLACGRSIALPSPLRWNNNLGVAAQKHADWMAAKDILSHGASLGSRVKAQSYDFQAIAENIANAYLPVDRLFQLWLNSERHCKNILNPVYQEIGIGKNGHYWSVVLGKPA